MTLTIETLQATPIARRRLELVERKGLGHPDTMCDALVEAISLALNRMYLERAGVILRGRAVRQDLRARRDPAADGAHRR